DGIGPDATFDTPWGVWGDSQDLYVTDLFSCSIRKIHLSTRSVSTFAGAANQCGTATGIGTSARFQGPTGIWGDDSDIYIADTYVSSSRSIRKISKTTAAVTTIADLGSGFSDYGVGIWGDGSNLWIADGGRQVIRKLPLATGSKITVVAGQDG